MMWLYLYILKISLFLPTLHSSFNPHILPYHMAVKLEAITCQTFGHWHLKSVHIGNPSPVSKQPSTRDLKTEIDRKSVVTCADWNWLSMLWGALGQKQPSILSQALVPCFSSLWCQSANLAAPSLPTSSSDQVRAVPLHHCFSCCSYSSRTAGNVLLIHPKKNPILLILCWCTKSFPPLACLLSSSWNKLPPYFWLLSLLPSMLHPSSILPFVLPLHTLYIPVSSLCLAVLYIFSGRI